MRLSPYKTGHCENEHLSKWDAETGIAIIDDATKRYILNEGSSQKHLLEWNASFSNGSEYQSTSIQSDSNGIVFGHNVVLASCEILN